MTDIFLASQSPRRRELLSQAGIQFSIVDSAFSEDDHRGRILDAKEYALANAVHKGKWVIESPAFKKQAKQESIVISADTIVVLGSTILEKPGTTENAEKMLQSLSGKSHQVMTGLCFHYINPQNWQVKMVSELFLTKVTFRALHHMEIKRYVATGEPMDKSGSYALQGQASSFVKSVNGSYTNVVGLPLAEVVEWINQADLIFQAIR